jgi:hypothetical protein
MKFTYRMTEARWEARNSVIVFIIGTAGSGKSLLTASFNEWLKLNKQDVITVNLDPGVVKLPYMPDIDIRNYVNIEELMEQYGLGPNGALVVAADLIAEETPRLAQEMAAFKSDVVLIDTPGQIELFAFRASGPYIVNELSKESRLIVYLFDSVFCSDPLNYVSNLFLSAAVYNRFLLPQVHVLSKIDLLPKENRKQVLNWSTRPDTLENDIERKLEGTQRLLSRGMMRMIHQLGLSFLLVPVSARNNTGLVALNACLERISAGGERYTY